MEIRQRDCAKSLLIWTKRRRSGQVAAGKTEAALYRKQQHRTETKTETKSASLHRTNVCAREPVLNWKVIEF